MKIISEISYKIIFFWATIGHCIAAYETPTWDPFKAIDPLYRYRSPTYRPLKQQPLPEQYCFRGAYLPIVIRYPDSLLSDSVEIDENLVLEDVEEETFSEMEQLLIYLKKDVPLIDKKSLKVLELVEKELQQARLEGIGRKGNYASVRVIDELVSVAAHLLNDCSPKHKKDKLKILLLRIPPRIGLMARNSSAVPYLENIAKNMTIASGILEIDLSFE
ncbi:MAG: hypothetical protein LBF34_04290 [Puniceicoccales bacterium]|nr:hypothetical protein [Puniceicoccales bacterium]